LTYSEFVVPLLVNAVKEQQSQIKQIKAKNYEIKLENNALKADIEEIRGRLGMLISNKVYSLTVYGKKEKGFTVLLSGRRGRVRK